MIQKNPFPVKKKSALEVSIFRLFFEFRACFTTRLSALSDNLHYSITYKQIASQGNNRL